MAALASDDGLDVGAGSLPAEVGASDGVDEVEGGPRGGLVGSGGEVAGSQAAEAGAIGDGVEARIAPCPAWLVPGGKTTGWIAPALGESVGWPLNVCVSV